MTTITNLYDMRCHVSQLMRGCFFYRLMKHPADLKGKNGHFWGGGARDLYRDDVKADMGPSSRVDI